MKRLLIAFGLVLLCALPAMVWGQGKPNLVGSPVLAKGECVFEGMERYCFLVKKDEVHYIIVVDRQGEERIMRVKKMPEDGVFGNDHMEQVWKRMDV